MSDVETFLQLEVFDCINQVIQNVTDNKNQSVLLPDSTFTGGYFVCTLSMDDENAFALFGGFLE